MKNSCWIMAHAMPRTACLDFTLGMSRSAKARIVSRSTQISRKDAERFARGCSTTSSGTARSDLSDPSSSNANRSASIPAQPTSCPPHDGSGDLTHRRWIPFRYLTTPTGWRDSHAAAWNCGSRRRSGITQGDRICSSTVAIASLPREAPDRQTTVARFHEARPSPGPRAATCRGPGSRRPTRRRTWRTRCRPRGGWRAENRGVRARAARSVIVHASSARKRIPAALSAAVVVDLPASGKPVTSRADPSGTDRRSMERLESESGSESGSTASTNDNAACRVFAGPMDTHRWLRNGADPVFALDRGSGSSTRRRARPTMARPGRFEFLVEDRPTEPEGRGPGGGRPLAREPEDRHAKPQDLTRAQERGYRNGPDLRLAVPVVGDVATAGAAPRRDLHEGTEINDGTAARTRTSQRSSCSSSQRSHISKPARSADSQLQRVSPEPLIRRGARGPVGLQDYLLRTQRGSVPGTQGAAFRCSRPEMPSRARGHALQGALRRAPASAPGRAAGARRGSAAQRRPPVDRRMGQADRRPGSRTELLRRFGRIGLATRWRGIRILFGSDLTLTRPGGMSHGAR